MRSQVYFPIFRAKAGEFSALAALSERTKPQICPFIDLPLVSSAAVFEALQASVVQSLAETWGTANELFLDLSRYDPDIAISGDNSYLARLFDSARQARLKGIPVAGPIRDRRGKRGVYLRSVGQIAAHDGRGAAIRLPCDDLVERETLSAAIDKIQREIGVGDGDCDLILDFGPTEMLPCSSSQVGSFLQEVAKPALDAIAHRQFRAIVLCASSIPRSLGRTGTGSTVRIQNTEFHAWSQLISNPQYHHLRFGDYAARYAYQSDKPSKASPPARIHLSTPEVHVLSVGKGPTYRELASRVAAVPEFDLQRGSWGKHAVRDAARGNGGVGNAADWVARDAHMHVETMNHEVVQRLTDLRVDVGPRITTGDRFDQVELEI